MRAAAGSQTGRQEWPPYVVGAATGSGALGGGEEEEEAGGSSAPDAAAAHLLLAGFMEIPGKRSHSSHARFHYHTRSSN